MDVILLIVVLCIPLGAFAHMAVTYVDRYTAESGKNSSLESKNSELGHVVSFLEKKSAKMKSELRRLAGIEKDHNKLLASKKKKPAKKAKLKAVKPKPATTATAVKKDKGKGPQPEAQRAAGA